jgi:hypothetical protein
MEGGIVTPRALAARKLITWSAVQLAILRDVRPSIVCQRRWRRDARYLRYPHHRSRVGFTSSAIRSPRLRQPAGSREIVAERFPCCTKVAVSDPGKLATIAYGLLPRGTIPIAGSMIARIAAARRRRDCVSDRRCWRFAVESQPNTANATNPPTDSVVAVMKTAFSNGVISQPVYMVAVYRSALAMTNAMLLTTETAMNVPAARSQISVFVLSSTGSPPFGHHQKPNLRLPGKFRRRRACER